MTVVIITGVFLWNTDKLIKHSYETFMFFTTDSNILSAIAALVIVIFQIRILRGKADEIPRWAVILKYIGATSVMVTFATVMLFLGPMYTYFFVLKGNSLYMHLFGPLLALVSIWFFEPYCMIRKREIHLAVLPMAIYGAVYLLNILINGKGSGIHTNDWYGFTRWGMAASPLVYLVMASITWGIAWLLWRASCCFQLPPAE